MGAENNFAKRRSFVTTIDSSKVKQIAHSFRGCVLKHANSRVNGPVTLKVITEAHRYMFPNHGIILVLQAVLKLVEDMWLYVTVT